MESTIIALHNAKWTDVQLERRLIIFERRASGVSMREIAKEIDKSLRQAYYDWEAIRDVLAEMAAPVLEEIRSKGEARLERIYSLLMAEAAVRAKAGHSTVEALRAARSTVVAQCELRGAIDRRAVIMNQAIAEAGLSDKTDDELRADIAKDMAAIADLAGMENGHGNGDDG